MSEPAARADQELFDGHTCTYATTVYPRNSQLSAMTFICIPAKYDTVEYMRENRFSLSGFMADEEDLDRDFTILELREEFVYLDLCQLLSWQLKTTAEMDYYWNRPNYQNEAIRLIQTIEIAFKSSPLKGISLAGILGSSSGAGLIELLHNGITTGEATVAVLFVSGAMILFGASNAVRKAVEAGLEYKLLQLFGVPEAAAQAQERMVIAQEVKSKKQEKVERRNREIKRSRAESVDEASVEGDTERRPRAQNRRAAARTRSSSADLE